MRLLFNMKSHMIEDHMSDSNVGGRKKKSGINHIWVINGVIHDQLSSVKKKPMVIQQYDYCQMFDGMESSEACGDMFDYGVKDDHLKLIHEANKKVVISVKTPQGQSAEYTLTDRVMQGDTWSSAMASAQVDSFGKEMLEEEPTYMYKFKGEVSIPLLGQVDDLIGVSEAGYKAHQLNSYVNVKTSDKNLQFGPDKCKIMIVSKRKVESFLKPNLTVDAWEVKHAENGEIIEKLEGKVEMKEANSLMYLGYMLSKKGDNMQNIIHKRNKCIGTQRQILKLVEPLGPYRFESAWIYIQSLIRNSILYASEAMTNVKEKEYRAFECIEESVIKQVFKTLRSCPRHLLYLEAGVIPARYQVHRQVLNFLQYILQQPSDSLLYRMLMAMKSSPTRGDWASSAIELLEKYNISLSFENIKTMKKSQFKIMVKKQIHKVAFEDLIIRKNDGEKGKKILYECLQMTDYLLPECSLNLEDKAEMFSLRTEMNPNPFNFGKKTNCELGCPIPQDNEHYLNCIILNEGIENDMNYKDFLNGPLETKIRIFKKIQENIKKKENHLRDSIITNC